MQGKKLSFLRSKYYSPLNDAPAKFYLSTIFGLSFTISSVAHACPIVDFLRIFNHQLIGNNDFENENEYINLDLLAPYIYETEM